MKLNPVNITPLAKKYSKDQIRKMIEDTGGKVGAIRGAKHI